MDTTALANGMHTIAWTVTDNQGSTEGIGSRYFRVSNGVGALTAAIEGEAQAAGAEARVRRIGRSQPRARTSGLGSGGALAHFQSRQLGPRHRAQRRGQPDRAASRMHRAAPSPDTCGWARRWRRCRSARSSTRTPASSRGSPASALSEATISCSRAGTGLGALARQDVRVVLQAKGSGFVGPQVVIDTPTSQADVGQPFVLAGWAADLNAVGGNRHRARCMRGPIRCREARPYSSAPPPTAAHGPTSPASTATSSAIPATASSCRASRPATTTWPVFAWSMETGADVRRYRQRRCTGDGDARSARLRLTDSTERHRHVATIFTLSNALLTLLWANT